MEAQKTIMVDGRPYVQVSERIRAVRVDHPDWTIWTSIDVMDGRQLVVARCEVREADGRVLSVGHGQEELGKDQCIELAETGAVGRALKHCGYGIADDGPAEAPADNGAPCLPQDREKLEREAHDLYLKLPAAKRGAIGIKKAAKDCTNEELVAVIVRMKQLLTER